MYMCNYARTYMYVHKNNNYIKQKKHVQCTVLPVVIIQYTVTAVGLSFRFSLLKCLFLFVSAKQNLSLSGLERISFLYVTTLW